MIILLAIGPFQTFVFLRAVEVRSTTSFRGEEKPPAPCCNILRRVEDPLMCDRDTGRTIQWPFFPIFFLLPY